jgi:hypothetical protein
MPQVEYMKVQTELQVAELVAAEAEQGTVAQHAVEALRSDVLLLAGHQDIVQAAMRDIR